jgi:serine protease AprX
VLGEGADEFTVIAALQFIRHLNAHKDVMSIHGVNLSLSVPHDVANFACGRTPVCEECERVVASGVVVVTAAGNRGFNKLSEAEGGATGDYRYISITDPGNAEGVITVGSTHRLMPHTYGVSYFSSRGPTGDGRTKPDLVAPGERIDSCSLNGYYETMDGTSMAAPHVSGAAALLLSRNMELIGQPRRVKEVLVKNATDLGREPRFQGSGNLDVLRALQSV